MNTTISRIAASAPVAVALLGFSVGSAHAAPYDPASADKVQIQPAGDTPDYWDVDLPISDDLPDGDPPADPDDIAPADPADDEESNDDTDGSGNGGNSSSGGSAGGSSNGSKDADKNEDSDEAAQAPVEAADVQITPASARGVQVAPELVAAAGVALAGVVGWAGYRRMKANAIA